MKFFRTTLLAASALTFAAAASAQMEGSGHGNHGTAQTQPTTNPADPAVTPGRTGAPATGTTGQGSTSSTAPADMTPPRPTGETPPQGRAPEQPGSVPGQPGATPD